MEVSLPAMTITGLSDDQPWRYVWVNGCEVLTLCDEHRTTRFVAAIDRSRLFVPEDFQTAGSRPLRCVVFDQFVGQIAPHPAGVRQLSHKEFGDGWYRMTNVVNEPSGIIAANLHGIGVEDWPELWMAGLEHYFDNVRPQSPRWVLEGLMGNHGALARLGGYEKSRRLTRLAAFGWDEVEKVQARLKASIDGHGLYPLKELFESPPPDDPQLRRWWELQAALFCRWQIYSLEGQRNGGNGFWNWARLGRKGPVDEEMFKHCLGMDYAAAESRMLRYLDRFLGVPHDVPIRLYPLADELKLRPAREAEIARLLGAFQWQEAKRLKDENKEQAAMYEAAARRTYERGIKRTGGNASLHAGLGLLEYESGHKAEARPHLEKAFVAEGADARALLALARLRFEEAQAAADSSSKLDTAQLSLVLAPLFAARQQPPVEIEVYRLIGEAWSRSAIKPEAKHLAVLLEGIGNYPHDLDLAAQVVEVQAMYGYYEIAQAVARRAAKLAGRSAHRARFETLLADLTVP